MAGPLSQVRGTNLLSGRCFTSGETTVAVPRGNAVPRGPRARMKCEHETQTPAAALPIPFVSPCTRNGIGGGGANGIEAARHALRHFVQRVMPVESMLRPEIAHIARSSAGCPQHGCTAFMTALRAACHAGGIDATAATALLARLQPYATCRSSSRRSRCDRPSRRRVSRTRTSPSPRGTSPCGSRWRGSQHP